MKRFTLLLLTVAVACVVETPRDRGDDGKNQADAGGRDAGVQDAGMVEDAGTADAGGDWDAGETDAGETDAGETDAGETDAGETDGGSPVAYPRQWGEPVLMAGVNSSGEDRMPAISEDLLRLCFISDRMGNDDIFCATRTSSDQSFGPPVPQVNINSSQAERLPVIWRNELYFCSNRTATPNFDIYRAKWNAIAGTYDSPIPVPELNSSYVDGPGSITRDGLVLFMESTRLGLDNVWVSTRSNTSSTWGTPVNITSINSGNNNVGQFLTAPDMSFALFVSDRPVPGRSDTTALWLAEANPSGGWMAATPADIRRPVGLVLHNSAMLPDGALIASGKMSSGKTDLYYVPTREPDPPSKFQWGTPVPVAELNTSNSAEVHPTMTADRLRICFTSDRPGGKGNSDIWCAFRSSTTLPFNTPVNMGAINSAVYDAHPALSSDGAELFFYSYRSGGGDIYRAVWVPADNAYKFPEAVTALNSASVDSSPALTGNDLVILFDSERAGGSGKKDLYMATRSDRTSTFGTPLRLADLSSAHNESDPAPAPDGYSAVFSSDRPSSNEQGAQPSRLWAATFEHGSWSAPELIQFDAFANMSLSGATILSDGSLAFHSSEDLYIAPPK